MALSPDIFTAQFLDHPQPIIYSHAPEVPQRCLAVIPNADGSFSKKSARMGLGSFLLEAQKVRDVRTLWHSWDEEGLWRRSTRINLADALNKSLLFYFDNPVFEGEIPEDFYNPEYLRLENRESPILWGLLGKWPELVLSMGIPEAPTKTRLQELGLAYALK